MSLISCPECSHEVSQTTVSCPQCGYSFQVVRRGPVGKAMKYCFIWFNVLLLLWVVSTFFAGVAMATPGDDESAAAGGLVALFGMGTAAIIWFSGVLFWGLLVYISKGKLKKRLTPGEVRRDSIIFWSPVGLMAFFFLALPLITMIGASVSSPPPETQEEADARVYEEELLARAEAIVDEVSPDVEIDLATAASLFEEAKTAYKEQNYTLALVKLNELKRDFPDSEPAQTADKIIERVEAKLAEG